MRKRRWTYTIKDMAKLMNRSIHTVRDDRAAGKFDPGNFAGVVVYMLNKGINAGLRCYP